ncbi:MAG TPA: outer membrane beta-barrel protein [Bryobacteraceae bacterium]|nr:outer membrane beta-barrel protein [Bryobacteraceae bacterium]
MTKIVYSGCFALIFAGALSAQEVSRFSFELGGGFTQSVGNTGHYLDNGWNVKGGVGVNFTNYIGVLGELGYNSLGFNGATLNNLGYPSGQVNIFSATLDPIVHLTPHGHFDLYAVGGGGLYHWDQSFGSPAGAVTSFNTGSFPVVIPSSGNEYTVNKPGWNAGMGVAFGTKWHGKIFAEARYVHVFLNNGERSDFVPVTFGFRW